ncbi:pyridoxine 5'-phosphate synthase [Candidatus Margulisiibacteriota bacterium]
MKRKVKLGVNIDHIATLRQARKEGAPNLIDVAKMVLRGGADSIVAHLREDRRHIQDQDIIDIRKKLKTRFDMEMAATMEMVKIALKVKPDIVTLVPEKRRELTTEGGLDVIHKIRYLTHVVRALEDEGIKVSLFIDPAWGQIEAAKRIGASFIEIHTGKYSLSTTKKEYTKRLKEIAESVKAAKSIGLRVNAGHGLNYNNVRHIAMIKGVEELNIGFSIVARAVYVGISHAVSDMKRMIHSAQ